MIKINIIIYNHKDNRLTLAEFINALKALNEIYGNDSLELAAAVGRLYDNFCRR